MWGVLFAVHYLVYKTGTVDEDWVAERTADLHSKSYDAGHINQIAAGHGEITDNPPVTKGNPRG